MHYLKRKYGLIINHKKVYRLCKELDIKYGYIEGEDKFFYMLNIIDIFDRNIVDYHIAFRCEIKDAIALLRKSLRRDLFA